jgi:hypothetical protein
MSCRREAGRAEERSGDHQDRKNDPTSHGANFR